MFEEPVSSAPTFWVVLNSWFTPTVFFVLLQLVIGTIYITSSLANSNQKQHQQHHHHHHHEQDSQGADGQHPQQLARSPSALQRLKSINFYSYTYRSQEPTPPEFQTHEGEHPQIARSPSVMQRLKSINLCNYFPTEPISSKYTTDTSVFQATHEDVHKTQEPGKHHMDNTAVVETDEEKEDEGVGQIQHEEPEPSLDEVYSQLQLQGRHFNRTQSDTKPASGEVPVKLPRKMKKSASTKSAFSHFKEDDIVEDHRPVSVTEPKVSAAVDGDDDGVDAKADDFINKFKQQLKLQRLDSITRYKDMIHIGSGK